MAKQDRADNPNKARGRADAPGQIKVRQFINDATGETIEGTMNDFHTTLREQGYRPVDDTEDDAEGTEVPA